MVSNSVVDERALREIYLRAFEKCVKNGKPRTVMCAYNLVNGEYCSENDYLQNKVLREEWGFDGIVVSDWGAVNERVKGLRNGNDLEMPSSGGVNDRKIVGRNTQRRVSKMSDIVFGRYSPNQSAVHKIDARNKILMLIVLNHP